MESGRLSRSIHSRDEDSDDENYGETNVKDRSKCRAEMSHLIIVLGLDERRNRRKSSIAAEINGSLRNEPFRRRCAEERLLLNDDIDDDEGDRFSTSRRVLSKLRNTQR